MKIGWNVGKKIVNELSKLLNGNKVLKIKRIFKRVWSFFVSIFFKICKCVFIIDFMILL